MEPNIKQITQVPTLRQFG